MNVLLINPPTTLINVNGPTIYPPMGLAYISAVLEKEGINCNIVDLNLFRKINVLDEVKKFNPNFIGISVNISSIQSAIDICNNIKKEYDIPIIFGGPYATSCSEELILKSSVDCIVRGEGEFTMLEIVKHGVKGFNKIKGISYKDNGIKHNPNREINTNLDILPFPSWHLLPNLRLYKGRIRRKPVGYILTSRGCPYQCIYCNKNIFGLKFRARSPNNIIEEISLLVNNYGVKEIEILDDNFTLDINRANTILDMIIEKEFKILISFENGIRADRLTPELIKKMKKAGVYKVGIGVESGSPRILEKIRKSLDLDKVKESVSLLKKEGILVSAFFMLGLPGDNEESMKQTIGFAKELNPYIANFAVTVPLPGTDLYDLINKKGNLSNNLKGGFYNISGSHYEIEGLDSKVVEEYLSKAYKEFYFRFSKFIEFLVNTRSYSEFRWLFFTSLPFLKRLILRS